MINLSQYAKSRYTTKAFDPKKKIAEPIIEQIRTLLRYSPSSINSQPWHFIIVSTDEGKARLIKATQQNYAYNESKICNASHIIVFCARTDISDEYLAKLLAQEEADGRFATPEAKAGQNKTRNFYINSHRQDLKDIQPWMERQVYLNLGTLLLGAAMLEIDACPMEGFDHHILDQELELASKGLKSLVMVALGYRSSEDFNAKLPKSRFPSESLFTNL